MKQIDRRSFLVLVVVAAAARPAFARLAEKSSSPAPLGVTYYFLPG